MRKTALLGLAIALLTGTSERASADPRAQFVLEAVTGRKHALDRMLAEPGAAGRLAEFQSAARGRFAPPPRMRSG